MMGASFFDGKGQPGQIGSREPRLRAGALPQHQRDQHREESMSARETDARMRRGRARADARAGAGARRARREDVEGRCDAGERRRRLHAPTFASPTIGSRPRAASSTANVNDAELVRRRSTPSSSTNDLSRRRARARRAPIGSAGASSRPTIPRRCRRSARSNTRP